MTKKKLDKTCPQCGSETLTTIWITGRKLTQLCESCDHQWNIHTPPKRKIETTKTYLPITGTGYHYVIYDKYGHSLISSRSYGSHEEALKAITKDLDTNNTNKNIGPCTAVLWPPYTTVEGTTIKGTTIRSNDITDITCLCGTPVTIFGNGIAFCPKCKRLHTKPQERALNARVRARTRKNHKTT